MLSIDEVLAADRRRVIRLTNIENNILAAKAEFDTRLRDHPAWTHERRVREWETFMRKWDWELREIAS